MNIPDIPLGWLPLADAVAKTTVILLAATVASIVLRSASAALRHLVWTLALSLTFVGGYMALSRCRSGSFSSSRLPARALRRSLQAFLRRTFRLKAEATRGALIPARSPQRCPT